jgi:hypothetical protein
MSSAAAAAAPCIVLPLCWCAVFQAERDSERFALYAKKAALDERATELRAQLKVRWSAVNQHLLKFQVWT